MVMTTQRDYMLTVSAQLVNCEGILEKLQTSIASAEPGAKMVSAPTTMAVNGLPKVSCIPAWSQDVSCFCSPSAGMTELRRRQSGFQRTGSSSKLS